MVPRVHGVRPGARSPCDSVPVLAVTGRKDLQVDADDVERMRELVTAPFEGETPAELTHLLRTQHGRHGLDTYAAQLTAPMDADLIERIAPPKTSCLAALAVGAYTSIW